MGPNPTPDNLSGLYDDGHVQVTIDSFSYLFGKAPRADLTIDARRHLVSPHPGPVTTDGRDSAARQHMLNVPGARRLITRTSDLVRALLDDVADARNRLVRVAIGCADGQHHSVSLAEEVAVELRSHGVGVEVSHTALD